MFKGAWTQKHRCIPRTIRFSEFGLRDLVPRVSSPAAAKCSPPSPATDSSASMAPSIAHVLVNLPAHLAPAVVMC